MPNISEYPRPILTYFTIGGDDYPYICLAVTQGRCYGNQLNLGDVARKDLYSLSWCSTMNWLIINPLSKGSVAIIQLYHVQIW